MSDYSYDDDELEDDEKYGSEDDYDYEPDDDYDENC